MTESAEKKRPRKTKVHVLKTWSAFFHDLRFEGKNFEVRKNDRDYNPGDVLLLRDFDPDTNTFSGDTLFRRVMYVLEGGCFGVEAGFAVLAIEELPEPSLVSDLTEYLVAEDDEGRAFVAHDREQRI